MEHGCAMSEPIQELKEYLGDRIYLSITLLFYEVSDYARFSSEEHQIG